MRLLAPRSGARRLSGHLPRGTAPGDARRVRSGCASRPGTSGSTMHSRGSRRNAWRRRSVISWCFVRTGSSPTTSRWCGRRRAGNHRSGTGLRSARVEPAPDSGSTRPWASDPRVRASPHRGRCERTQAQQAESRTAGRRRPARRGARGRARIPRTGSTARSRPGSRRRGHLLGESPAGTVHGSRAGALRRRPATPTTRGSAHASSKPLPIRRGQGHAPRRTGSPTDG